MNNTNNSNSNMNSNNMQLNQQQLQMLRQAGMANANAGNMNSNGNNMNFMPGVQPSLQQSGVQSSLQQSMPLQGQQQLTPQQQMMFLMQQQQHFQQQMNSNNSPNLISNQIMMQQQMKKASASAGSSTQSPNLLAGLMSAASGGMGNGIATQNQMQSLQQKTQASSPQIMAQALAAQGLNPQLYLAQQQQLMNQQMLLNPAQLAAHQQNQLLFSANNNNANNLAMGPGAGNTGNSPGMTAQQMNQFIARQHQLQWQQQQQNQAKINFSPQSHSSSPSMNAQQLFAAQVKMQQQQQQQQQQNQQQIRPAQQQQFINAQQQLQMQQQQQNNLVNNTNPAATLVNSNIMQQQRPMAPQAGLGAANINPNAAVHAANTNTKAPPVRIVQQQARQVPQPQQQQQLQQQEAIAAAIARAPLFPNCPQQSIKLFNSHPLHGLLDLHASIHGSYATGTGSASTSQQNTGQNVVVGGMLGAGASSVSLMEGNSGSGVSMHSNQLGKGLSEKMRTAADNVVGGAMFDDSHALKKRRLSDLVEEVHANFDLDADAERCLLRFADDFLDKVILHSAKLAKHSGGTTIQVKDVQLELERNWNIRVPGYEGGITETSTAPKKSLAAAQAAALNSSWTSQGSGHHIHNQRLAALFKAKRDSSLSAGLQYTEIERRAKELASAYELRHCRGDDQDEDDDISEEVVNVSAADADVDGDNDEGEADGEDDGVDGQGDMDHLEDEGSEDIGDGSGMGTPSFVDSPHISV